MVHLFYRIPCNFKESKLDVHLLIQPNGHKIALSRISRFQNVKYGLVCA